MTLLSTLNRTITAIRFRMARAAPLTVAGRRPVVLTESDLDAALARRRAGREQRAAASRKGWATRNHRPLVAGIGSLPASPAREGFGSPAPSSFPAPAQQRGKRKDRHDIADEADRTRGASFLTRATGLAACQRNRAAQSIPAETPKVKGGRHATR